MGERTGNAIMAAFGVGGAAFFFVLLQQGMPLAGQDVLFAFLFSGFSWFSVFFVMYSVYGMVKVWFQEVAERYYPPTPPDDGTPPDAGNGRFPDGNGAETAVSHEISWGKGVGEEEDGYVARIRSYRNDETDEEFIAKMLAEGVARRWIVRVIPGRAADVLLQIGNVSKRMVYA